MYQDVLICSIRGILHFYRKPLNSGMYIGLGSDKTIKELKGRETVYSDEERAYMISALSCVHKVAVNRGSGLMDFEEDMRILKPDIFIVNEDGHSPEKEDSAGTWALSIRF